eukprot:1196155-Prorocentrum_minimum.AAC.3
MGRYSLPSRGRLGVVCGDGRLPEHTPWPREAGPPSFPAQGLVPCRPPLPGSPSLPIIPVKRVHYSYRVDPLGGGSARVLTIAGACQSAAIAGCPPPPPELCSTIAPASAPTGRCVAPWPPACQFPCAWCAPCCPWWPRVVTDDVRRVGRRGGQPGVAEPTERAVDAEAELVHVALLDLVQRVLERAVRLFAPPGFGEDAADGHPGEAGFPECGVRNSLLIANLCSRVGM